MIKEILVFSRMVMDLASWGFAKQGMGENSITEGKPWYLISIYGSKQKPLTQGDDLAFDTLGCKDALSLQFDDISEQQYREYELEYPVASQKMILFGKEHAERIFDFLDKIQEDEEDSVLAIHCHAGISRSGAVAVFTAKKYGIEFSDPYIQPNGWILFNLNLYNKYHQQRMGK